MKIAYILEVNPYEDSGIIKKVRDQVGHWTIMGHEVILLISWPLSTKSDILQIDGKQISNILVNFLPNGFVKNFLSKVFSQRKLRRELEVFKPDILYTRQNTWYPGITTHLKKYKSIIELNSVDKIEIQFYGILKRMLYKYGRPKILKSIDGMVAVTPDILKHYSDYPSIRKIVVSNGINLNRIQPIREKANGTINLVFVGSRDSAWHGLDKLMSLARIFPKYSFNVVGYDSFPSRKTPQNIKFHGWINKKGLEKIYAANHFGIGSFGNHLVGKNIDSTLKVREYLAYGLPVIMGHTDVDFMGKSEFTLRITDSVGNFLDKNIIQEFLDKKAMKIVHQSKLTEIDSSTKEKSRLEFFKEIFMI